MELTVYEGETAVGTLTMQRSGIFYDFRCQITKSMEQIHRLYVGKSWQVVYLGIPDASGVLNVRVPCSHLREEPEFAIVSVYPRGQWMPWRGEIDGVPVASAFFAEADGQIELLLAPEEALKFPAWLDNAEKETLHATEFTKLILTKEGKLPTIENRKIENGEKDNEEIRSAVPEPVLSADAPADESIGNEGREADCPDL